MRKYLAVILAVLFILSFTATAFAVHETTEPDEAVVAKGPTKITLGGKILVKGWYLDNVSGISGKNVVPTSSDSIAFWHQNVYLTVNAKVSDNLMGMVELETASGGDNNPNSGLWYWGANGRGYDSKPFADILIRQAWIQYTGTGLLGVPAGLKIGHMPISLGEKQFLNNERFGDDALIVWIDPMKELHLLAGTVKLNEGANESHTDDLDGYVLLGTYQWDKDNTVGAYWLWAHSDGNCPSSLTDSGDIDDDGNPIVVPSSSPNVDKLNFHNVGIHGNGKIAGLSYGAEADFQFGKVDALSANEVFERGIIFPARDEDIKGWAVMAKLGYMIDPVNIRAAFAYGSGDDNANDGDCEEFQTLQGNDYGATARLVHYTQIYERTVRTAAAFAALSTTPGVNTTNTGIANTTYYNLGLDVTPLTDLSVSLDGFLLYASETGAWKDAIELETGERVGIDDDLGWEIDVKLNYKITKNLTYFVEGGYFDAGHFYEDTSAVTGASDTEVKQLVHGLLFTF